MSADSLRAFSEYQRAAERIEFLEQRIHVLAPTLAGVNRCAFHALPHRAQQHWFKCAENIALKEGY